MLPLGAEVQVKRMLIACRVRNVPAWSGGSDEEDANSMQDAECPHLEWGSGGEDAERPA